MDNTVQNTTEANSECLFCQIAEGKVPCHEVWSSPTHLAFLTIFPNTPGVTVVIPRQHYSSYLFAQNDQVMIEQMLASKKVAQALDSFFQDSNRTGVVFEGFGVDHLHTKLYPLHGTGNLAEWQKIDSQTKNDFFEQYPGYISSHNSLRADDEQLGTLAAQIREATQA